MAQQTAVEWLFNWMSTNQYFIGNDLLKALEQAKEMEQQKKLITEIMEADAKDGLYEEPILSLKETPFAISFTWKDKVIKVELENGEDVLKLATIFSDMLSLNGIPHKVNK